MNRQMSRSKNLKFKMNFTSWLVCFNLDIDMISRENKKCNSMTENETQLVEISDEFLSVQQDF